MRSNFVNCFYPKLVNLNAVYLLDIFIGLVALFGSMAVVLIVGTLGFGPVERDATKKNSEQNPVKQFFARMRRIGGRAKDEVLSSLRLVLITPIWLFPAFGIAFFSYNFTGYLNQAARCFAPQGETFCPGANLLTLAGKLFMPVSGNIFTWGSTLLSLTLGAFAIAMVILAVAVAEENADVFALALSIIGITGRAAALLVVIFLYSLAVINGAIYLTNLNTALPFQVGPAGLVALLAAIGISLLANRAGPKKPQSEPVPSMPTP